MTIFDNASADGKLLSPKKYIPLFDYNKFEGFINSEYKDNITSLSDNYLNKDIPATPPSLFREFITNGNRTHYEAVYFEKVRMMLCLALGEYANKNGKYMQKLIDVLWDILNMDTWVLPAHVDQFPVKSDKSWDRQLSCDFKASQEQIDLFSASTASDVALVWYFLHDEFEKEIPYTLNARILYELDRRIFKPYLKNLDKFWWSGFKGTPNNWCPWITSNVLCVTALTCKSGAKREKIVNLALKSLSSFISGYSEDGGCNEGASYWGEAGEAMFDALQIIYDMSGGKLNFFDRAIVKNMGEYQIKMNIDGLKFINFADGAMVQSKVPSGIYSYGLYTKSQGLMDFGKHIFNVYENKFIPCECNGYRLLCQLCTDFSKANNTFVHKQAYEQKDLQIAVFREGSLMLAFKGGSNNESHNHNDVGTVTVFKNNHPVLLDTGSEAYTRQTFGKDRYKLACMRSIYHNTLSVDDTEQYAGSRYRAKYFTFDEKSKSSSMNLTDAYHESAGIVSYTKSCRTENSRVISENKIKLNSERTVKLNFMTCEEPNFSSNSFTLKWDGGSSTISYNEGFEHSVEVIPVSEHPGWENSFDSENLYRIILSKKMCEGNITFTVE